MSSVHLHFDNFNAGEISPLVGSRMGVEKVMSGCRKLRNFVIHPHGPAFRRPGMQDMGAAISNDTNELSRLVPFQFSASTVFLLEFSEGSMRVWRNGALVTLAEPVEPPYAAAELSAVQFGQANDIVYLTHPNYEPRRLIRYADDNWVMGVVPWRWPAMGDENPGAQVPDQYDLVHSYDLSPHSIIGPQTFNNQTGFTDIRFLGTPPAGVTKRLYIEREYLQNGSPSPPFGWLKVSDQTWDGSFPTEYPITSLTASPAGIATNNFRIRYHGPGWTSGLIYVNGSTGQMTATPATPTAAQPSFVLPAGLWRYSIHGQHRSDAGDYQCSRCILQKRATPGSGSWTNAVTFNLSSLEDESNVTDLLASDAEFRWAYDGFESAQGLTAFDPAFTRVEKISLSAQYQTSLAISDPTVGAGRTLTSNRPIFLPGHVGSYWQITHRRENAFVELVSTSPAVAATGTLTFTAISVANQTVTIGNRIYTWVATAAAVANTVDIGASATDSRDNLIAAINGAAGAGTLYGSTTAPHADVTAAAGPTGTSIVVTARNAGTGAHTITLTDTMSNAAWDDVFIHGGVGANTVISAASTAGIRIQGKWEVSTYGSWDSTLYLERQTADGGWEFVRSWRSKKDRNISVTGETDGDETLRLRIAAGTASETSTEAAPRFVLEPADSRTDGLVKITAIGTLGSSGKAVTVTCDVISPCLSSAATYVWTEGAFSDVRGYPRSVALHEQRLWFGGTGAEAMRLWGSVIGDIENFRRTRLDDGAISLTPTAGELNPIQWMQSQGADLIFGTLGDEWTLGGEGEALTPTNFQFRRQSRFGSAATAAILVGEVVAFVQRGGRKVRRISSRSENEPWATADMTVLAEHVALNGIREMAFSSNPTSVLWAVTNDGKLLGMTLEVEQNVFGWHVHETDGVIESVAVIYGEDVDEVWLSVLRAGGRRIERLDPAVFARRFEDFATMIYSDCAKVYDGAPTSTVSGLSHLNGKTVCVLADGAAHAERIVSGGQITLSAPASKVVVGLPFTSELQPSRREIQTPQGTAQGQLWRVSRVGVWLHESQGGSVAESVGGQFEALEYPSAALYSGDLETAVESESRSSVDVIVKTSAPLPLNVGAIVAKLDLYGD